MNDKERIKKRERLILIIFIGFIIFFCLAGIDQSRRRKEAKAVVKQYKTTVEQQDTAERQEEKEE